MLIYFVCAALSFLLLGMMMNAHYRVTNLEAEVDELQAQVKALKKHLNITEQ